MDIDTVLLFVIAFAAVFPETTHMIRRKITNRIKRAR